MSDYATAFQLALARTAAFDLPAPEPAFTPQRRRWLTEEVRSRLGDVICPALSWPSPEAVATHGHSAHECLVGPLADFLGTPVYFTLGAVIGPGLQTVPPAEADLARWLSEPPQILLLASWLTLPSHEIINIAFPTSRRMVFRDPDQGISAYAHHPDEIQGIVHRPLLVGAAYLHRLRGEYGGKLVVFPSGSLS